MGLLRTVGRTAVVAGTATRVSNNVSRRQQQRWAQQEQAAAPPEPAYAPPPQAAPAPAEDDTVAQLNKFASLHESGVLTDEEFAAAKAKVLGL